MYDFILTWFWGIIKWHEQTREKTNCLLSAFQQNLNTFSAASPWYLQHLPKKKKKKKTPHVYKHWVLSFSCPTSFSYLWPLLFYFRSFSVLIHMVAWPVLQISQRSWRKSVLIFVSKAEIRILILKKNKKNAEDIRTWCVCNFSKNWQNPPFFMWSYGLIRSDLTGTYTQTYKVTHTHTHTHTSTYVLQALSPGTHSRWWKKMIFYYWQHSQWPALAANSACHFLRQFLMSRLHKNYGHWSTFTPCTGPPV